MLTEHKQRLEAVERQIELDRNNLDIFYHKVMNYDDPESHVRIVNKHAVALN